MSSITAQFNECGISLFEGLGSEEAAELYNLRDPGRGFLVYDKLENQAQVQWFVEVKSESTTDQANEQLKFCQDVVKIFQACGFHQTCVPATLKENIVLLV